MHISHHITQQLASERGRDLREEGAHGRRDRRGIKVKPRAASHPATATATATATAAAAVVSADADGGAAGAALDASGAVQPARDRVGDLVGAAAAGDDGAWDTLVATFAPTIAAVTRRFHLNEADAADVAQLTWVVLYEHIDRLSDPSRVGAWLATTARRQCLRLLRGNERHVLFGDDLPECESADPAPGDALLTMERDEALWRNLGRLEARDQALLGLLVGSDEPDYQTVSSALDMPVGSIGPTRQRALRRLRGQLERTGDVALMQV
jgi:RNA polymerase sigma factor (sigma-70 family)